MSIFFFILCRIKFKFLRILYNELKSPTLYKIPPFPLCKISLGPTLQSVEMINFLDKLFLIIYLDCLQILNLILLHQQEKYSYMGCVEN